MKAITLHQPWATSYRGLLAIHAAKRVPKEAYELVQTDPFDRVLRNVWHLYT